ncbi:hypothetical protein [Simiduia aestuariiviva]|uniref:Uncharacterized protein n=1 Tax=Simiduia aestuariiviva TaxID=1510459 RepID=A0A839USK4_9GAMM|nr:hypothetical protein [Simiduia aestuariiviva]MBB3168367.1 hypothetical protein [Simiduia aestuariiviva]
MSDLLAPNCDVGSIAAVYCEGVKLVGRLLGFTYLAQSDDFERRLHKSLLGLGNNPSAGNVYGILYSFEFQSPEEFQRYIGKNFDCFQQSAPVKGLKDSVDFDGRLRSSALEVLSLSDNDIRKKYFDLFDFKSVDLLDLAANDSACVFHKLNHGYWEYLLLIFLGTNTYSRYKLREAKYETFNKRLRLPGYISALYQSQRSLINDPNDQYYYAISCSAGIQPIDNYIEKELTDVARGAMAGAIAYRSLFSDTGSSVYDGYAVKSLCYRDLLFDFIDVLAQRSDALVFIVPQTIKNIRLDSVLVNQYVLAVPRHHVHEYWPSVLALCIGYIDRLRSRHNKLTVIMECGAFSALLSVAMKKLNDEQVGTQGGWIKSFDLGRVLDSSNETAVKSQRWLKGSGVTWRVPFKI